MIKYYSYLNCLLYFSIFIILYSLLSYFKIEGDNIEKILFFIFPLFLIFPYFNNKKFHNIIIIFILAGFFLLFKYNIFNFYYLSIIFLLLFFINLLNNYFKIQKLKIYEIIFLSIIFLFSFKIIFWKKTFEIFSLNSIKYLEKINIINTNFYIALDVIYFIILILVFFLLLIFFQKKNIVGDFFNKSIFINLFFIIIFYFASFNTSGFFQNFGPNPMHHWQTYIGPVELMLQGGYLLWDTPSQYGFLSTIFIYLMPFDDPWMKLYYLNALLTFSFSIILFLTIWNKGSFLWLLISFLITYSVIFLLPGGQWQYNISSTPSSGMMRFFISVMLIFLIVKLHTQLWIKQILVILPVWLLGVFWSFESAFYCCCIIFPWIIHNILFEKNLLRDKITTILVFPLSFLIILGFISLYYLTQLGNLPDYWAFAEYAFAWIINSDQMINSVPEIFTIDGSINLIIILFLILLIFSKEILFNKYLFYSSILFLWSVNSLIIGKGTDFHINSILFLFVYIFFLLNSVVNLNYRNIYIKILSPLLIVIIIASYLNPSFIKHIIQTIKNQDYNLSNVSFQNDKNMNEFIAKINSENISIITISSKYWNYNTEMYFYNNSSDIQMKINHEKWLPVLPATLFMPISKERAKTYIRRWIERKGIDRGWLIFEHDQFFHKDIINKVNDALIDFKIEKTITYKNLKALYYEKN